MRRAVLALCLLAAAGGSCAAWAQSADHPTPSGNAPADTLDGTLIYQQFRDGLAEPDCTPQASDAQWQRHFSRAPARLADESDDILPLFGYVVGAMRDADLPTEFALIPFVESGYHPGASSGNGPSGLWQFVSLTARNHGVRVRKGYDGRLSPVDSTQAAVRYLKTLHGMFGGNWRLAVMAYNAGENRVLQSLRKAGVNASAARPAKLPGLSRVTYTYVQKLHALACSLEQAGTDPAWVASLRRPVPRLQPLQLPADFGTLAHWAQREGHDAGQLAGLNPAVSRLRGFTGESLWVLAPAPDGVAPTITASDLVGAASDADLQADQQAPFLARRAQAPTATRSHTVARGDSIWSIAHRYGLRPQQLLQWNGLNAKSVIKPGMVLQLAAPSP